VPTTVISYTSDGRLANRPSGPSSTDPNVESPFPAIYLVNGWKRVPSRSIRQGRSRFGNTTKLRECGAALVTAQSLRQGANVMRRVKRENGFTLIEILIATAITAIVMIAGTAFIAKFARTSASFAEDHELEESRGTLAGILRSDFDGAGRNLTRPSAPGAGKETVSFLAVPDYSVDTPGRATRLTTETGAYPSTASTRAVTAGGSVWEFTPSLPVCRNCWTTLYGSDGSARSLAVDPLAPAPSAIVIYENGSYAATSFGVGVTH
jgi:prepilin-type N-terminal cleavage/methylation domain-containing protein